MSIYFTPEKSGGMGMPDLSTIKQNYDFAQRVNRDTANKLRSGFSTFARDLKRWTKSARRKSKPESRKIAPAPKVSMSNGSGQMTRMQKRARRKRTKAPLKKRVARLEKKVRQNYSTYVMKQEATLQVTSSANRCGYGEGAFLNPTIIETCIDAVPIVNTAAPGTPATLDTTSLTQPTKWTIKCYARAIMRNNYLYPVNVRCYVLKPKIDQSASTAQAAVTGGLTEQASGAGVYSTTAPFTYPTDSKEFIDTFDIVNSCDMKLQSGDECIVPYNETIQYDQEYRDNNTDTYLKKYSRLLFIRVVGVVAHDQTTTTNIGIAPTALDVVIFRKLELKYPTLAPLKTTEVLSGLSSLTTSIVGIASAEVETGL